MSKQSDSASVVGIIGAIILFTVAYPLIWLYEQVGGRLFLIIIIGIPASIFVYKDWKKCQLKKAEEIKPIESAEEKAARKKRESEEFHAQNIRIIQEREQQKAETFQLDQPNTFNNDPWLSLCVEVEAAWKRSDYDWARQQLQKIAYGMVGESVTDDQRKNFTRLMTVFAKEDPLYKDVMERVTPLVQANPGMLQSQIYKGQPDHIKEQMRYVLYFANEIGHIKRVKKGNSYKLFSPDSV